MKRSLLPGLIAVTLLIVVYNTLLTRDLLDEMQQTPKFDGQSFTRAGVTTKKLVNESLPDFKVRIEEAENVLIETDDDKDDE